MYQLQASHRSSFFRRDEGHGLRLFRALGRDACEGPSVASYVLQDFSQLKILWSAVVAAGGAAAAVAVSVASYSNFCDSVTVVELFSRAWQSWYYEQNEHTELEKAASTEFSCQTEAAALPVPTKWLFCVALCGPKTLVGLRDMQDKVVKSLVKRRIHDLNAWLDLRKANGKVRIELRKISDMR